MQNGGTPQCRGRRVRRSVEGTRRSARGGLRASVGCTLKSNGYAQMNYNHALVSFVVSFVVFMYLVLVIIGEKETSKPCTCML